MTGAGNGLGTLVVLAVAGLATLLDVTGRVVSGAATGVLVVFEGVVVDSTPVVEVDGAASSLLSLEAGVVTELTAGGEPLVEGLVVGEVLVLGVVVELGLTP